MWLSRLAWYRSAMALEWVAESSSPADAGSLFGRRWEDSQLPVIFRVFPLGTPQFPATKMLTAVV